MENLVELLNTALSSAKKLQEENERLKQELAELQKQVGDANVKIWKLEKQNREQKNLLFKTQ